jgi:hypothetical protein
LSPDRLNPTPAYLKISAEQSHPDFLLVLIAVTAAPVVLTGKLWAAVWRGDLARAWDGTGHSAIAQIYDQSIFPSTFGWTHSYFGGMPFPNFYPPLFYWCVALLHHTHLVSFASSFKLMVVLPVVLMPGAIWVLAWFLSNRNRLVATAAALASVLLLVDLRIMGTLLAGLDYFSTFQIGLYTQPLGFVLLIGWYVVYSGVGSTDLSLSDRAGAAPALSAGRFALSSLLLALTVLANFFNATTAAVLILTTVVCDLVRWRNTAGMEQRSLERRRLISHILSPLLGGSLTLFWLAPMLSEYRYFVTRPYVVETQSLISPGLAVWFAIALIGSVIWVRGDQKRRQVAALHMWPYLAACTILAMAVIFAAIFAPSWFPLQTPRFLATLTFLLTVPVGFALAAAFRLLARLVGEISSKNPTITLKRTRYTVGVTAVIFLIIVLSAPDLGWSYAFYPKGQRTSIDDVLDFARQHRDGRYLVEVINPKIGSVWTEASFDARAINSYLGSQGNETISGVFHEASPNALFTLPLVNAFSNYPDSFGVSSMLADDLDFVAQPLSEQIKRAQFLGVKYLVIRTPAMKERVSKEITSTIRHDIGWWAVFELPSQSASKIQALPYKPALVLSSFTVKARRRNEMSFIRLAEEQFADNWFEVLLARSPESRIDRLADLDKFGALILDSYDYSDEEIAFQRLREFAKTRALICLSSDNPLFRRIEAARAEIPLLEIVERRPEERGEIIEALKPTYHYGSSSIRQQWKTIRGILERNKIATGSGPSDVEDEIGQNTIRLANKTNSNAVPILIATTFHPNWSRNDGGAIYAATPFYMLTFLEHPISINYQRTVLDRLGIWLSGIGFVVLCLAVVVPSAARLKDSSRLASRYTSNLSSTASPPILEKQK